MKNGDVGFGIKCQRLEKKKVKEKEEEGEQPYQMPNSKIQKRVNSGEWRGQSPM